ncbi:MAG: hypothetical protein ACOC8C_00325, partial [Chloroflexota bacterium]
RKVAKITAAGEEAMESHGVQPLCLLCEDTDGDSELEWVGLYLRPGDPPRLEGFVLDGDTWHELTVPAADEDGLGTYPACTLRIDDINLDGEPEVVIRGRAGERTDILHIFAWSDSANHYRLLASFRGDAGIALRDNDGDLLQEVVARWDAGHGLAWEQVHTWDGKHYAWTWERYSWLYADYPHYCAADSPERTVICYYLRLNDRDLPSAYRLLSSQGTGAEPYAVWTRAFDAMLAVEVGSVQEMKRGQDAATVTAHVRRYENVEGYVIGTLWDSTWTLVRDEDTWRLVSSTKEQLDQWEARYFDRS